MNKNLGIITATTAVTTLGGLALCSNAVFAVNDASTVMVIQSPIAGTLNWYTTPGVKWRGFGKVTTYPKRDQFWFSNKGDQGKNSDESLKIRFNDGAHATISGSISWEMPVDNQHLNVIHAKYGSHQAVEQQLVRTVLEKAIYTAGPLMSSSESYAERKNELLRDIEEQIEDGVYETETIPQRVPDPMSGQLKTVNLVRLKMFNGKPVHAIDSPLKEFGIKTFNLSVNEVHYDPEVEKQIQQQQKSIVAVQIAIAAAKQAEQNAITTAKEGEAEAAKAKWAMEVQKAKAVTEAEMKLSVAELNVKTEDNNKRAAILKGEGEAAARQLVMKADGALDKKLATYEKVSEMYATAIQNYKGNWVPGIVMGGSTSGNAASGSGAEQLIQLLNVKTAKDLALDLSVPKSQSAN